MTINTNKRCPRGTRRNKKSGNCISTSTKLTNKRCPKGTRRNKKSGNCINKMNSLYTKVESNNLDEGKKYLIFEKDYYGNTIKYVGIYAGIYKNMKKKRKLKFNNFSVIVIENDTIIAVNKPESGGIFDKESNEYYLIE